MNRISQTEKNFLANVQRYHLLLDDQYMLEVEQTGVTGYCDCCGTPKYLDGRPINHDPNCVFIDTELDNEEIDLVF